AVQPAGARGLPGDARPRRQGPPRDGEGRGVLRRGRSMTTPVEVRPFVEALRERLGVEHVAVRPSNYPGEPDTPWFLYVLGVPPDDLPSVSDAAWDLALEMYGTGDMPFFLAVVDPETSREHFAEELGLSA